METIQEFATMIQSSARFDTLTHEIKPMTNELDMCR